jgi:Kef-type K+ transport system membrane component KefB
MTFVVFGILFLVAALVGKFVGATFGAKVTGNNWKDSLCCGAAMIVRAEVCLVSAQKGIDAGLINPNVQIFLIILIILTSFVVPLILKLAYKNDYNLEKQILNASPSEIQESNNVESN